jgi:glycine cleavage system regulatory protein
LFVLEAELQVPSEVVLSELRRELAAQCEEENLDLSFEASGRG